MGCINDKPINANKIRKKQFQNKYHHSVNPIIQIAKEWNVEIIKQRWHDNETDVVKAKLGPKTDKITKDQFIKLIPVLNNFDSTTQDHFYDLFNFQQNATLSVNNFVISQIIILKSDDYDLLADMFFFAYSSATEKTHINTKDYNTFARDFKQHQLEFMHQAIKPTKDQNGQIFINKKLFRQIFQQYDIKTIKNQFKFNVKDEERKLQKYLSTYGIDRKTNNQVFMVDFRWFAKWKNYMEYKYGIKLQIKENGKHLEKEKNYFLLSTFQTNAKWIKQGQRLASQAEQNYMEPVNNERIQGEQVDELRQGLIEFSDFISVPAEIWNDIRIVYGGGPSISKPFPFFYNKRITLTILDQSKCEFVPGFWKAMVYDPNETFQMIYKKRQQRYFLKDTCNDMFVYYKHPGELEWKKITDLNIKLQNFPFQYKSFVVFVKTDVAKKFQDKFNLTQVKGKKQIKQRVRNYGNLLNFQHEAILQQGYVGGIFANSVILYLKSAKGQYLRIQNKSSELENLNPHVLDQNFMQGFAGLENIGNTCYINAPLQCLLKTPYFDEYMDSVNLDRTRKDMLTYQLQQIHEKSQNSRDCISMSSFKRKFDEKFTFFEGSAQHDAQQFLLILLDKLSEQQPRQSLLANGAQNKKNKKIHNFFSGKTRSETECLSCHNKGHTQQSFFTYSLSLPIINQTLFSFYFIDEDFKVKKYGLTIQKECEIGQIIRKIENQLKIDQDQLLMMSICDGEWMNDIHKLTSSYKISKLQNYDSTLVCYPIKIKATPDYEDLVEGRTKNSIKLEVRNRVFDQKKKSYKPFHFPFCLQVDHQTTGKSLTYSIIDKIKKFINDEEYHLFKEFQEEFEDEYIKLLGTHTTDKDKPNESSFIKSSQPSGTSPKSKSSREKIKDLPFKIQYLKKEDGVRSVCWFCKRNIDHSGKKIDAQTDCVGCEFLDSQNLYQTKAFMKGFSSLLISIDWKNELFSKDWTIQETRSYQQAKKEQSARKSQLTNLLKQASDQEESIQLKCQKPTCTSNQALRKQFIIQAPNILILHLKRFYYKDNTFHKLKTKVVIPQEFQLPGFSDKYELYGNVVHYGSGTGRGGHYINYVKVSGRWYRCDDEKVHFTEEPDEHLNPDTYLLFYKRKKIDKSWAFFGF